MMNDSEREAAYIKASEMTNKITGNLPTLEFEPESIKSARARFPMALRNICDPVKIMAGEQKPPSKYRTHVFDFKEGIRVIVSVDDLQTKKMIHVSGSYTDKGAQTLFDKAKGDKDKIVELAKKTLRRKFERFAPGLKLKFLLRTPTGVFHFEAKEK